MKGKVSRDSSEKDRLKVSPVDLQNCCDASEQELKVLAEHEKAIAL